MFPQGSLASSAALGVEGCLLPKLLCHGSQGQATTSSLAAAPYPLLTARPKAQVLDLPSLAGSGSPRPHLVHPSSLQGLMGPRVTTLLFSGPDPNPRAKAAWRLAELEAWAVHCMWRRHGYRWARRGHLPSWPAALRSYLTLRADGGLPGRSQVGARPQHWPRHAWRSVALVRAGGQGRLGEQGPQHAAALPPSSLTKDMSPEEVSISIDRLQR